MQNSHGCIVERELEAALIFTRRRLGMLARGAYPQVIDPVRDIVRKRGEQRDLPRVECIRFLSANRDRPENHALALQWKRDRGPETVLQSTLPPLCVLWIVENIARDMRLACLDDVQHESLVAA